MYNRSLERALYFNITSNWSLSTSQLESIKMFYLTSHFVKDLLWKIDLQAPHTVMKLEWKLKTIQGTVKV